MSSAEKVFRNRRIRERHQGGETMAEIARDLGISRQRVDQIVNRQKHWCRDRFTDAKARGLIVPPTRCDVCGADGPVEGHHRDYEKPLAVDWLCVQCHHSLHASTKPTTRRVVPCPVCDGDMVIRPNRKTNRKTCSRKCSYVLRRGRREATSKDLEVRRGRVARCLRQYAIEQGYVPGTVEFCCHHTGRSKRKAVAILALRLDPNLMDFTSYAACMDDLYERAGFVRPGYGRARLPQDLEERFGIDSQGVA